MFITVAGVKIFDWDFGLFMQITKILHKYT